MAMCKAIGYLAAARVLFERLRANKKAYKAVKVAVVILLALMLLWAYTASVSRHAANKAGSEYKAYLAQVAEAEEEAARIAAEQDPYTLQLQHEASLGAKMLEGLKLYHYDEANKRTLLQCVCNRVLNPAYPSTVEDVLTEKGQFAFYNQDNPVTEDNYRLCYAFFDAFHNQERLHCSYDLVFVELGEKVVLRDTFVKGYDTQTWWYGK